VDVFISNNMMRNQYKILAEKYEQMNQEGRKPGTPKVTPYTKSDGTTAYKSLDKWGHRQDWRTSAAAHKAAGIPEPKQVKEIMEPVDDKPDAEDRVAAGITAKLDMTDKSHDSVLKAIKNYWIELDAEWKQYHPTQPMPEDVKEELWQSVFKGMEQAGVDPTDLF
jgi:hypothetical protein